MIKIGQEKSVKYSIKSWRQFACHTRRCGSKLLAKLDDFPNAILIAGCQRSGTTALSRLITESDGMIKFWSGGDEELEAALILAGYVSYQKSGRHCFQTTYLNNNYEEYFEHSNYKLVWVLRNPFSVIYSMLNNWKTAALNRLFVSCGVDLLDEQEKYWFERFGLMSIPKMRRACLSYNGKVSQTFVLSKKLSNNNLLIIDYDELIKQKTFLLPGIYDSLNLVYKETYADRLNRGSLKKAQGFSSKKSKVIEETCFSVYSKAKILTSDIL